VRGMKSVKLEGQGVWFEKFVLFCFFYYYYFFFCCIGFHLFFLLCMDDGVT
jgi:hypothetical protein